MIGTVLIESLVQSVALTHRIAGYPRANLLLLAAPESGKTTIATAADAKHVQRIAVISGRSILREVREHKDTEFLLFNDLSAVRAMSNTATNLLIVILNQITQDERGTVAFAGDTPEKIERQLGIIGCLPFKTFVDHRARWRELGFVSRMIPFCYSYPFELVARIKDSIDSGPHAKRRQPQAKAIKPPDAQVCIRCSDALTREVRNMADARSITLEQIGIRLLANYHTLVRAHALRDGRKHVTDKDLEFLRAVDAHVSID